MIEIMLGAPKAGKSRLALSIASASPNRMTFAELAPFADTPLFIPMLFKLFAAGWVVRGDALVKGGERQGIDPA